MPSDWKARWVIAPLRWPEFLNRPTLRSRGARRRFFVEGLEDRCLLTTLFAPQHGVEVADDGGGGERLGNTSPGVPIYLIFWGSYWSTSDGLQQSIDIRNFAENLYHNWLLGRLAPVRDHLPGLLAADPSQGVFNYSDPTNPFSDSDIRDVVNNAIDNQGVPESDEHASVGDYTSEGVYLVVTPPNVRLSNSNVDGYHGLDHDYDFPFDYDRIVYGWVGNFNGLNQITNSISHVL